MCNVRAYIHQQVRVYMWGGVRGADLCACVRLYCTHVHLASNCQTALDLNATMCIPCVHVKAHMIYCDDYNLYRNINNLVYLSFFLSFIFLYYNAETFLIHINLINNTWVASIHKIK